MPDGAVRERLAVIAEPNRFRIVELLRAGPRPVGAIGSALHLGQPQVSRHLRVLADAGVVAATKRAQQRVYRLEAAPLREIVDWARHYESLWTEHLDRLGDYLESSGQET